jgi:hypothetical protein
VTPDAARYVCKRHGATYDLGRLKSDSAYNAPLGAAELGGLLEDYRGSYIATFAAYNAGRGSVKKWIERYGDPRDPKVDAIDWVEANPVLRDPQLRAADHGEFAGLSHTVRRRDAATDREPTCTAAHGRSKPRFQTVIRRWLINTACCASSGRQRPASSGSRGSGRRRTD